MTGLPEPSARALPFLLAVLAAASLAAAGTPSTSASAAGACSVRATSGAAEAVLAAEVIRLVNAHRRSLGLRPVRVGPVLTRAAVWKARHMAQNRYLAHPDLPGGRTLAQRLRSCGFVGSGWGEVLAAGQRRPARAIRAWLASPSHQRILEARFWRTAGAGVARSRDGSLYWVVDFGA